jgi:ribulose-5-phosphate 4-epimerase/fuculose-1-phosphate aldolase
MEDADAFRAAGRTLYSFGLVKEAEGNLSTFRDGTLRITRTGSRLAELGGADVLSGSLSGDLPGGSSDLAHHRRLYATQGEGAVAHSHPPGSVPEGPPGEHGLYTFGPTLEEAVARTIEHVRGAPRADA